MNIQRILMAILLLFSIENFCQDFSTLGEIYNFELDDQFQILTWEYNLINNDTSYFLTRKVIQQKNIEQDKIIYVQDIILYNLQDNHFPPFELIKMESFVDTSVIYNPDSIIFSSELSDTVYTNPGLYNGRKINESQRSFNNFYSTYQYTDGCGLVNYSGFSTVQMTVYRDSLLYYKKGEETWGSDAILRTQEYINPTSKLFLYPNPVFSKLKVEIENPGPATNSKLEIYNSRGKQVIQTKFYKNKFTLDCTKLKSGLYFLKINSEKDQMTSKFIKQ